MASNRQRANKSAKKQNIYAMRRQKKRKKILKQTIWFLLLVMAILVLYQRRDSWLPKLETIGLRHQSYHPAAAQDGQFPLYVTGGIDYQTGEADGNLLVLTDSYLNIYDPDGTQQDSRQHTYGSAMLQTAGKYALIYESGGTHFRLETTEKTLLEKTVTAPIIFGRVSTEGQTALVTTSETSACVLTVFNAKGQQIYQRSCVEELADLAFQDEGTGCFAVSIFAEGGTLKSVVSAYDFSSETDLWHSQTLDTLVISVYNTGEGNVFVLGDTRCCFLNSNGSLISSYIYPDQLGDCAVSGDCAVLRLVNSEKHTNTVVILNGNANAPVERGYSREIKNIGFLPGGNVLIQMRSQLQEMTAVGNVVRETAISDSYDRFLRIGHYLFLCGYQQIDRMDYQT